VMCTMMRLAQKPLRESIGSPAGCSSMAALRRAKSMRCRRFRNCRMTSGGKRTTKTQSAPTRCAFMSWACSRRVRKRLLPMAAIGVFSTSSHTNSKRERRTYTRVSGGKGQYVKGQRNLRNGLPNGAGLLPSSAVGQAQKAKSVLLIVYGTPRLIWRESQWRLSTHACRSRYSPGSA